MADSSRSLFLFYGDDTYSHQQKLKHWQREFEKKHSDINLTVLEGSRVAAKGIFEAACAVPFLGDKRFIIVRNFLSEAQSESQSACADLLEKIPEFTVLVFSETESVDKRTVLFKRLQKLGTVCEFSALSGSPLISWIFKKVEEHSAHIEKDACLYLAELVGGDLNRLENEIVKLSHFAIDRPITKQDIDLLVTSQFETSIFRLTDGIGQKNRKVSLRTLHELIDSGEELHRILYMIMRQLRIILCVKDLADHGMRREEIVRTLKEHPFVISNTLMQAKNFSSSQLARAYELLIDLDSKVKSGGIKVLAGDNREFVLALDRLVLKLCEA